MGERSAVSYHSRGADGTEQCRQHSDDNLDDLFPIGLHRVLFIRVNRSLRLLVNRNRRLLVKSCFAAVNRRKLLVKG